MRKRFVHEPYRLVHRGLYHRMDAQALRLLIDGIVNCGGHIKNRCVRPMPRRFVAIEGKRQ